MFFSQVGSPHLRVVAHLFDAAGQHRLAVHQHRDAVGEGEHRVHVMLDQQDRVTALEAVQQLGHARGLVGAHPGRRLIEQ
ncbi:hypothetical protein D3C76_1713910 [compost metagenome]